MLFCGLRLFLPFTSCNRFFNPLSSFFLKICPTYNTPFAFAILSTVFFYPEISISLSLLCLFISFFYISTHPPLLYMLSLHFLKNCGLIFFINILSQFRVKLTALHHFGRVFFLSVVKTFFLEAISYVFKISSSHLYSCCYCHFTFTIGIQSVSK